MDQVRWHHLYILYFKILNLKEKRYRRITDCLVIVTGLVVIGIITNEIVFYYIAAALGVLSVLIPPFAKIISFLWEWIGRILGFFISKIILTVVFYCFLFPISILFKLFSTNKSISKDKRETYWIIKEKTDIFFNKLW